MTCARRSRVTIDIDGYIPNFRMKALAAYYGMRREADEVEVRVSSSRTGIHIVGWFDEYISDERKDALRRELADDDKRLLLDHIRGKEGHTTNVLWEPDSVWDDIESALAYIEGHWDPVRSFERDVKRGLIV